MFSGSFIFLVVLSPSFLLQTARATESRTNCSAVAVSNDLATINCNFPLDLNQTKRSFCIIQYDGGKKRTDVVTACSWEGADLLCVFEEGFHFQTTTITNEFTVEMPNQKSRGAFSCDTIPPDLNVLVEKCTMPLTDETGPSGNDENGSPTTTPDPLSESTKPSQGIDNCTQGRAVYVVFIVILSLATAILIFVLVCLNRRHKLLKKRLGKSRELERTSTYLDAQKYTPAHNGHY